MSSLGETCSAAFGVCTEVMTLTRFLNDQEHKFPDASGELTQCLNAIATSIKAIAKDVRKAGIEGLVGLDGKENITGDQVKKLDTISNKLMINLLRSSYTTCMMVSEENEKAVIVSEKKRGKYIVCFDPLDGSSNIDVLISVGTIFSISLAKDPSKVEASDALIPGKKLLVSGYALYGSGIELVITLGHGVNGFHLDPDIGEFILTEPDLKIPKGGKIYSINEGYAMYWDRATEEYVKAKKFPSEGKPYSARYTGSMVADIHRTLKYGGVFMYPATSIALHGKLRLLYECNPLAMIVEQAGGASYTNNIRTLDIQPESIHQRVPIVLGAKEDVEQYVNYISKFGNEYKRPAKK